MLYLGRYAWKQHVLYVGTLLTHAQRLATQIVVIAFQRLLSTRHFIMDTGVNTQLNQNRKRKQRTGRVHTT